MGLADELKPTRHPFSYKFLATVLFCSGIRSLSHERWAGIHLGEKLVRHTLTPPASRLLGGGRKSVTSDSNLRSESNPGAVG